VFQNVRRPYCNLIPSLHNAAPLSAASSLWTRLDIQTLQHFEMRSTLKLRRNMLLFLVCVPILLSCQWGIWLSNLQPLKENVGCYLLQEHIKILAVYFPPSFVTKLVLALEPAFAPLCCNAEHQVPEVPSSRGHQVPGVTKFQRYEERPDTKSSSLPHTKGPHKSGGGRNLEAVYSQGVCPDCATGPPAKPQCNPV